MKLYFHPISSYSQKVLVAFHEKGFPFEPEIVDLFDPEARAAYAKVYPFGKVPLLVGGDNFIPESSIIIEYVDAHFGGGTRLIPEDKDLARRTRFYDRLFDLYVNEPVTTLIFDSMKPAAEKEPKRVEAAKTRLDQAFAMFDRHFEKKTWTLGDDFTMADCAAAPALAYARMVHPYDQHKNLSAYFGRLAERPSVAKTLAEAQPYLAKMASARK